MAKTPEGKIQEYGNTQLKARGCLVRKMAYEGRRASPDTLVGVPERPTIWGKMADNYPPRTIFIEWKKHEDTEPEAHQIREHNRMRAVGMDVRVIGSKRQVDELIKELFPCD
ncbi:hypothetical protein [Hafnia phage TS33]|nr:hypothetical protein [Hafnia phage TS33]